MKKLKPRELIEQEYKIPAHTLGALYRYANEGIPTRGFLREAIENNFTEALLRADREAPKLCRRRKNYHTYREKISRKSETILRRIE